jgi:hypothetical protein
MKMFVLVILAVLLAGCGTTTIVEKTITKTVTASPSPTVEAEPSVEPLPALSGEELEVYEFVVASYPKLGRLWAHTDKAIQGGSDSVAIIALTSDGEDFVPLLKRWNRMDFVGGQIGTLEENFDQYIRSVGRYYKNWLNGITGGNIDQCAANAFKAEGNIDRWGPRVESELERLEALAGESY